LDQQIPVFEPRFSGSSATPRIYCYADHDFVQQNAQHFELIITRRAKRIKRAYLRSLSVHSVRLLPRGYGQCKEQLLPSGHVCFALGGIRGSN
jgi:hypothetical protein